jgi:predicted nucleotidyltransferase
VKNKIDTKKRENEILEGIISTLTKHLSPKQIILFGSRVKKKYNQNTDFDIAIDEERVNVKLERKIREEIEKLAGLYKVDIIFLKSVDPEFRDIVLKTGKIIYERSS